MWTIFKVSIDCVTILLLFDVFFYFFLFGFLAISHVGSYLPDQRPNPHLLHLKAKSSPWATREAPKQLFLTYSLDSACKHPTC